MQTYTFKYLDGRIENMEGRNKKHAYSKMKKLYPDDIPYSVELLKKSYTFHSEMCLRFGISKDCPVCDRGTI